MGEGRALELGLPDIQATLTQRKKDTQDGQRASAVIPPCLSSQYQQNTSQNGLYSLHYLPKGNTEPRQSHLGTGCNESIEGLIDGFYDDDAQITQDCISDDVSLVVPKPPALPAQLP